MCGADCQFKDDKLYEQWFPEVVRHYRSDTWTLVAKLAVKRNLEVYPCMVIDNVHSVSSCKKKSRVL